ncbi:Mor transcription activator family protein [Neptuniibacter sp.]|uniref:Mor transcription activator family protein n=1 Tax=Neptuniibacter sp. TaxID=1962643 RepID=UPI00345C331A
MIALIDIFAAALERMGYKGDEAQKISLTLLYEQSMYCGGRYFYLPKKDGLQKAIRDINLFDDWSKKPFSLQICQRVTT